MAYSQADILEADDKTIGALAIGLVFIAATAGLLGFISQNTTIFSSRISEFVVQFLIAFGFLFILAILANYKGLDVIQDHAYGIIKWSYLIGMGIFVGMMFLFGLFLLPFGFIMILIGAVVLFFFYRSWPFIRERIRRAAEWMKIATTIVLNEPGMIVLSFIQSVVVGITVIVETISLIGWQMYADSQAISQNTTQNVAYLIMFLYLWLSLTVIYYFDGANTFISYARIHGKDPKVGQGLNAASKRILSIVGYALISAIVFFVTRLLVLRSIEMERESDNIGTVILAIVIRVLADIAVWLYHLVSFFTLPAIIIRQKRTTEAMSESFELFKRTFWDLIISDMGYGYASNILYIVTGLIVAIGGFIYGYFLASVYLFTPIIAGIVMAIIALFFGLFASKFFLKPLYTALVTTMYVYATEGPEALKIINPELKSYLDQASHDPRFLNNGQSSPMNMRR